MVAIPGRRFVDQLMYVSLLAGGTTITYTHASEAYAVIETLMFTTQTGGAGALYFTLSSGANVYVINAPATNTTYQITNLAIILQKGDTLTAHNTLAAAASFQMYGNVWI